MKKTKEKKNIFNLKSGSQEPPNSFAKTLSTPYMHICTQTVRSDPLNKAEQIEITI